MLEKGLNKEGKQIQACHERTPDTSHVVEARRTAAKFLDQNALGLSNCKKML